MLQYSWMPLLIQRNTFACICSTLEWTVFRFSWQSRGSRHDCQDVRQLDAECLQDQEGDVPHSRTTVQGIPGQTYDHAAQHPAQLCEMHHPQPREKGRWALLPSFKLNSALEWSVTQEPAINYKWNKPANIFVSGWKAGRSLGLGAAEV